MSNDASAEVLLALWFHDAIYRQVLAAAGAPEDRIARARANVERSLARSTRGITF